MNLLNIAIAAAVLAGEEIMKVYASSDFEVEFKDDNSPLTKADRISHKKIMEVLHKTGIPVLSEEGRDTAYDIRKERDFFWLVDPLDGTKEFLKRNGEFTVNIALINFGEPVLGVIFVPVTSMLYYGEINTGAYKAVVKEVPVGEDITCGDVVKLPFAKTDSYTIVASRSHLDPATESVISAKQKEHGRIKVASIGSSLKFCLVAEGSADYYPRLGPTMEWDTAAGHAIAYASGCMVKQHSSDEPLTYNKEDLLNPWFEVYRA